MRQRVPSSSSIGTKSLNKIASELALGDESQKEVVYPPVNWETTVVSCGSNAFGQLYHGGNGSGGDLMSSLLKSTVLPLPLDGTLRVEALSCGHTLTAAIVCHESDLGLDYRKNVVYLWGAGLPGPSLRVPTPLSIRDVRHISCGHSHCGLITANGLVFTWGAGDDGMLGHGSRTAVGAPRVVAALSKLKALAISCGAYHTGIIACEPSELQASWVSIPTGNSSSSRDSSPGRGYSSSRDSSPGRGHDVSNSLQCGELYTCGMNKCGQLGLGTSNANDKKSSNTKSNVRNFVATPKKVSYFDNSKYLVAKVSCGMHHTLILGVQLKERGVGANTAVFSCGWGEYGRLGTGDEEQRGEPTKVEFEIPFCATEISAGEQHSLASGREGAYAWGSNSMGQLGVGSPTTTEMALSPMRIPLPEGMDVKQLAAGGRHSAAITKCGKLLSWGWGEEGQLGGGNEKNAAYPRPVRIPKMRSDDRKGVPVSVAVGMSHTVVILKNEEYVVPLPKLLPAIEEIVEPPLTPPFMLPTPFLVKSPKSPPTPFYSAPEIFPEPEQAPRGKTKSGLLFAGEDEGDRRLSNPSVVTAVRSIRELLQQRGVGEDMQPASVAQEEEEEVEDIPNQELETSFAFFMTEGGDED